jgi:hypothetical protein
LAGIAYYAQSVKPNKFSVKAGLKGRGVKKGPLFDLVNDRACIKVTETKTGNTRIKLQLLKRKLRVLLEKKI